MPSRMLKITRLQLFFMGQVRKTYSKHCISELKVSLCNCFHGSGKRDSFQQWYSELKIGRLQLFFMVHTVQTADLYLPRMGRIPKMHSWIENKFMLRLFLCILELFLPPNFTLKSFCRLGGKFMLSCFQAGGEIAPVRIPNETPKICIKLRE